MNLPDLTILKHRKNFLTAQRGRSASAEGFTLRASARPNSQSEEEVIRVGFTCSKKVGNAVARNRAKRRLREAARLVLPDHGQKGWDYVLIGHRGTTARVPFNDLCRNLEKAVKAVTARHS